jgi:hypothetical protein
MAPGFFGTSTDRDLSKNPERAGHLSGFELSYPNAIYPTRSIVYSCPVGKNAGWSASPPKTTRTSGNNSTSAHLFLAWSSFELISLKNHPSNQQDQQGLFRPQGLAVTFCTDSNSRTIKDPWLGYGRKARRLDAGLTSGRCFGQNSLWKSPVFNRYPLVI